MFNGNTGSAICADGSVFTLYNVTIANNTGTPTRAGGLLLLNNSNFNILNTVVYGNTFGSISNYSATPTFYYCDVEGSGGPAAWNATYGINGGGNKDVNPVFTSDFKLANCSPAINAGDNASIFGSKDLANNQRIINNVVDMGAYERTTDACTNCLGENVYYYAGIGTTYQWQVDTGTGYSNLNDVGIYTGVSTNTLKMVAPPTNWRGYKYRCLVNGTTASPEQILSFSTRWNGSVSTAWENVANWDCGTLPDGFTDVIVPSTVRNPVLSTNTSCFSLNMMTGSNMTVNSGFGLIITGK